MKFSEINFQDVNSKRVYTNYIKRLKRATRSLSAEYQNDVLLEFNSHIYEGVQQRQGEGEMEKLLDVIDTLGNPEEVLRPLVADKKMEQATKSFNPLHIVKALVLNFTNGVSYFIFFLLYLMLFGFVFLIGAKIFNEDSVGLFYKNGSFMTLGKRNMETISSPEITEVLGHWFIPVMLLLIIFFYLLITALLKLKRTINKKQYL